MVDGQGDPQLAENTGPKAAASRRLRSDLLLTFGSKALIGLAAFAASIVAARELGPSGRGVMAVALTLTATLMQVGHLGFVSANPYFAARNPRAVPQIIANSLGWAATLGPTLIGAVVVIKLALPHFLPGVDWPTLLIAVGVLPAALATVLLQGVLLGEGRMLAYNLPQAVLGIVTVTTLVAVASVSDLTVATAVALMVAQWLVAAPVYYALTARGRIFVLRLDRSLAREMINYALRVYTATVLSFLVIRLDLFLVNAYLGAEQAGLYSVATVMAEAMFILPLAIGMNIFFRVARDDNEEDLTTRAFRSLLVVYGAFCLVAALLVEPVIPLVFGAEFAESAALFLWLLPGIYSLGMLTILSYHFAGRGYPREAMLHWAGGLALNLILNATLLNELGTYFAALASSITYTLILFLHLRLYAREVGWQALRPRLGAFLGA